MSAAAPAGRRSDWRVVKHPGGWTLRCQGPIDIELVFAHLSTGRKLIPMVFGDREEARRLARTLNAIRD